MDRSGCSKGNNGEQGENRFQAGIPGSPGKLTGRDPNGAATEGEQEMGEAIKVRTGLLALVAAAALALLALAAAPGAKAATVGGPVNVDFTHAGINVEAALAGELNELILTPSSGLGALELRGEYTDANGAFSVDKDTGLIFPPLNLDLGVAVLSGSIGLDEDATGTYNEATGDMTLDAKIALTIGVDDVAALPLPGLGTGPLACRFAPLEVAFSTTNAWPAPGNAFNADGSFTEGAVAGAFRQVPPTQAIQGLQSTCELVGGLLQPVGGIWLANTSASLDAMPAPTGIKPCEAGKIRNGSGVCVVPAPARISKVTIGGSSTAKRGKVGALKVTVTNGGDFAATGVRLKVSGKGVSFNSSLGTIGAKQSKTVTVKAKFKSKGKVKATIAVTSTNAGKATAAKTITVR